MYTSSSIPLILIYSILFYNFAFYSTLFCFVLCYYIHFLLHPPACRCSSNHSLNKEWCLVLFFLPGPPTLPHILLNWWCCNIAVRPWVICIMCSILMNVTDTWCNPFTFYVLSLLTTVVQLAIFCGCVAVCRPAVVFIKWTTIQQQITKDTLSSSSAYVSIRGYCIHVHVVLFSCVYIVFVMFMVISHAIE